MMHYKFRTYCISFLRIILESSHAEVVKTHVKDMKNKIKFSCLCKRDKPTICSMVKFLLHETN